MISALMLARVCGTGGGGVTGVDAGNGDGGGASDTLFADAADPVGDPPDAMVPGPADRTLSADEGRSSFESTDDADACGAFDELGGVDCSAFCVPAATCCVENTRCCVPTASSTFDFTACDGLACLADTVGPAVVFGSPLPWVSEGSLVLGGDGAFDSGLLFPRVLDLRTEGLNARVTFAPPESCESCIESASIAVTTQQMVGANENVTVEAGLVFTTSRVSLIVANELVGSVPTTGVAETWQLALLPDGTVEAVREVDLQRLSRRFEPPAEARVVLFGHSQNPLPIGARFDALTIDTTLCNMPSAVRDRETVTLSEPNVSAPSLVFDREDQPTIAFASNGEIYIGADPSGSPSELIVLDAENPALAADDGKRYSSPELLFVDDRLLLFVTEHADDGTGASRIMVASGGSPLAERRRFGAAAVALDPSDYHDVIAFDQPTLTQFGSIFVMVVRARMTSGRHELRAFYGPDEHTFAPFEGKLGDFANGRVSEPSLTLHGTSYHLYFTRKVGARNVIVMLASPNMRVFRELGTVLRAEAGDGIAVESLDAAVDEARQLVHYVYLGDDGRERTLRRATRRASFTLPFD